ncbi:Ig-like domain repeat protein [Streptomyces sp. Q6]|uniref:Ig-like domain repeat protein n=1 Tax=Streptomyces citrinus TaxID=3118173 RepID=A0ACD5AD37_9ACTN
MRKRSISTAAALAVLVGSVALSAAATGSASADIVSVRSSGGIVVNGAQRRVFVGDRADGRIVAADYAGSVVDSVSGLPLVTDLALSDDGATLYATLPGAHEIVALSTATLDVTARYPVAAAAGPDHVAFTAGKLWFTHSGRQGPTIGSLDPASGTVALDRLPADAALFGQLKIDADPGRPGTLALSVVGNGAHQAAVVDVSGAVPEFTARTDALMSADLWDIDLIPGAPQVLANGYQRADYASGSFTDAGAFPAARAADVAPNGLVAQATGDRVAVFRPGSTQALHTYETGSINPQDDLGIPGRDELAWAPDSSRIFALVPSGTNVHTLKVLTDPTLSNPTLTVNAPSTATRGKEITVTGTATASVPLPAGTTLSVTRVDVESPGGKALPSATVGADGSYHFTDVPPAGGTVTYRVAYAGDADHLPATASDQVSIARTTPSLSLNKNGNVYAYGTDVSFTAHLGTTYKNRTVEIWANPYGGDRPDKLVKSGTVNSSGNFSATVDMTRDTVVTAVFAGDGRTASKSVKSTAYARVKVSMAVSKHYRTGAIGTHTYYWFHKDTNPLLTTKMSYYPKRDQYFQLQVYVDRHWVGRNSSWIELKSDGTSVARTGAAGTSGVKARVRSSYINASSGDNVNTTTYGSWKYLYWSN